MDNIYRVTFRRYQDYVVYVEADSEDKAWAISQESDEYWYCTTGGIEQGEITNDGPVVIE